MMIQLAISRSREYGADETGAHFTGNPYALASALKKLDAYSRRIPLPAMQRFLSGERALPHDGDGYVRCIGMALELRNRKPSAVRRVWFSKIRVQGNGRVDPEHRPRVLREAASARHGHGPVVHASHRFAERRLAHLAEWRPEEVDVQALRIAVNGRAGKEMI